jgi:fibroblast activation protein alpha
MNILFFEEIKILEENEELENALKNIQLPKEEIKKLEVDETSKIF